MIKPVEIQKQTDTEIDERSKQILYAVVQSYISRPDPVGSRFVTKKYDFGFSPATIRNVMADLEDMGYLTQPHTSAGRIPTVKGYRMFVNMLLQQSELAQDYSVSKDIVEKINTKLQRIKEDLNNAFVEVSDTLASLSNYIAIASAPKTEIATFRKIDLIRFKGDIVIAILLTDEGIIKNKTIRIDPAVSQSELSKMAEFINDQYAGKRLEDVKQSLFKDIQRVKKQFDTVISKALHAYEQILSFNEAELFVSGLDIILDLPDFADIAKIKELSKAIKDKHLLLKMLDSLAKSDDLQIIIGDENPNEELKKFSIVASPYKESDRTIGVIAIVGPTRMDYPKVISLVQMMAECLTKNFEK